MAEKKQQIPIFDLTQDDDDKLDRMNCEKLAFHVKDGHGDSDCQELGHTKRFQTDKIALHCNTKNAYEGSDSDDSSDCILILPSNQPKHGNNSKPERKDVNTSYKNMASKIPTSDLALNSDGDNDDDHCEKRTFHKTDVNGDSDCQELGRTKRFQTGKTALHCNTKDADEGSDSDDSSECVLILPANKPNHCDNSKPERKEVNISDKRMASEMPASDFALNSDDDNDDDHCRKRAFHKTDDNDDSDFQEMGHTKRFQAEKTALHCDTTDDNEESDSDDSSECVFILPANQPKHGDNSKPERKDVNTSYKNMASKIPTSNFALNSDGDNDDDHCEKRTLHKTDENGDSDCQELGDTKRFQTGKTARHCNTKNDDEESDSVDSSEFILILPAYQPKHGDNSKPERKDVNTSYKRLASEMPASDFALNSDDDNDDDLLFRPAFVSSAANSANGNLSFSLNAKYSSGGLSSLTGQCSEVAAFESKTSIANTKDRASEKGAIVSETIIIMSAASTASVAPLKFTEKERKKQLREFEKQQKTLEKDKAKIQQEHEKQQKQQERKRIQQEKLQQKETEKSERQQCLIEEQQEQGKFAHKEICIHLEKSLAESLLGGLIHITLSDTYMIGSPNIPQSSELTGVTNLACTHSNNDHHARLSQVPPIIEGCIQWSRRDYVLGGATATHEPTGDDGVEWLNIVSVVFYDPKVFLRLLTREILGVTEDDEDVEDDFPLLRTWVKTLRESYARSRRGIGRGGSASVIQSPRIVLILHMVQAEMSQQWVKNNGRKKRRKSFIPTNDNELHDAVIWMLIEERIECAFTSTDQETIEYIKGLTRALSEFPYGEQMTELECIKKLRSTHGTIDGTENSNGSEKSSYERATDSWLRMLLQIKGLTEGMAMRVVRYYPTARSLMDMYEDPTLTIDQKRTLLATLLMDGKRNLVKLSNSVYRLMTSEDPMELIL